MTNFQRSPALVALQPSVSVPKSVALTASTKRSMSCHDNSIPPKSEEQDTTISHIDDYINVSEISNQGFAETRHLLLKIFDQNRFAGQNSDTVTHNSSHQNLRIEIGELKGGITNVLLQASLYNDSDEQPSNKILVRAYGLGTSTIIDRDREFATHIHLHFCSLAPKIHARFSNGLVYDFVNGTTVDHTQLSRPDIIEGISHRIAQWHMKLSAKTIESYITEIKKKSSSSESFDPFPRSIWDLMSSWIDKMPSGVVPYTATELKEELKWIRREIGNKGGPSVVAHCDLLSGNVIAIKPLGTDPGKCYQQPVLASNSFSPSDLVTFIDYEYAMPAPRGFDIANHFMEWQGFECDISLIPSPKLSNPVIRFWAANYLLAANHFSNTPLKYISETHIEDLVAEILLWWGMPGFYWGIWAAIQSSISNIDFDYASYSVKRLDEYWVWKAGFISKH